MSLASATRAALLIALFVSVSGCDWFLSADQRITRAEKHFAEGDGRAAVIELQNALKSEPANLRARLMLAGLSLQMGDPKAADQELKRAIADGAQPGDVAQLDADIRLATGEFRELLSQLDSGQIALMEPVRSTYRGLALLSADQPDAALEAFSAAIAADPGAVRAMIGMAHVYVRQDNLTAALGHLEKAIATDPKDASAWLLKGSILARRGDAKGAVAAFETARQNAAGRMTQAQYEALLTALTEAQIAAGDLKGSHETHAELTQRVPEGPLVHFLGARIAMAEQQYSVAVSEAQRAVAAAPDQFPARLVLGAALLANQNYNQAEAELAKLVQQAPENLEARKLLAQANLRLQRPDAAMQVLAPIQQSQSTDPQLNALLGWVSMQRGEETTGIELLERSVAAQPDKDDLKLDLAFAYAGAGEYDKAIELLKAMPSGKDNLRRDTLLIAAVAASKGPGTARREVERLVAARPRDVDVLNVAGVFHFQQGELTQAREYLRQAEAIDPRKVTTLTNIAHMEATSGDDAAATAALEKVLAIEPTNRSARVALAQVALRRGDATTAVRHLEEVRKADTALAEPRLMLAGVYLQLAQPAKADELIREALAADGKPAVIDTVGRLYLDAGRYDEALSRFRQAVDLSPRESYLHLDVARAQVALGNNAGARESIEKARALQPASIQATAMLAALDLREGQRDQALARVAELKKANPTNAAVAMLEGDVALALQSHAAAAEAYATAYRIAPSGAAAAKNYRARTLAAMPRSTELLESWLERQPGDFRTRLVLAEGLASAGRSDAAIAQYERLVTASPRNAAVINNLAWLYFETSDPRAESTARQAYELAPRSAPIADTYGWILVQAGKGEAGLPILEQAVRDSSAAPEIRYHYAFALARAGQRDKARDELRALTGGASSFASAADARRLLAELEAPSGGAPLN